MKDLLFMLADLWMIFAGFYYGWRFIRRYDNYLLGLEWIIVATSGTNFLVWALLGSDEHSVQYSVAFFLDAFSRSVGITLILILGLLKVTHRYTPPLIVEVGAFALAIAAGLYLQQFRPPQLYAGPASFFVVVNVITSAFLAYFGWRLWRVGARRPAMATWLVTAAACAIAVTYDFFPLAGDDEHRTVFYTLALATWGTQMCVYFLGYRALHERTIGAGDQPVTHDARAVRA